MIIWLASYPKSGNTWIRTIIGQIINNNFDSNDVFKESKNIELYPSKKFFFDLDNDFNLSVFPKEKKKLIFKKTAINWSVSQSRININEEIKIFKTHNMLCKLNIDGKFCSFTDLNNCLGVIHIVRDPRNVFTSLKNHFSVKNDDTAFKFITNDNQSIGLDENNIPQLLSSWKNHYNSWKRFPNNNLLIKYENLIKDPIKEISNLIKYLDQFYDISISDDEINKIIENSSFKSLKNLEENGFFDENSVNRHTKEKISFFNLGPQNDWKNLLQKKMIINLQNAFSSEMKELGYL
tara:strand:+ start:361 stop:1239 length:879 start_codon:yes stop_codon:yes gene_type:complete